MKKKIILAALLIAAGAVAVYRLVNQAPSESLAANERMLAILTDGGCMECHSADPKLPFYANLPVAGKVVKEDIEKGYREFDVEPMMTALKNGEKVGEVDLAKVEKVGKKAEIALDWVKNYRAQAYPNTLAAAEFANEPIRPIHDSIPVDIRKVILGNMLYHDTRLSVDNTVSCATCHPLNTAGVDNKQFSEGVKGQIGGVNAPTVFNAHYNFVQFWDGRAATLAAQAGGPPLNPIEMGHTSFDDICKALSADKAFEKAFMEVYPEGFTEATITDAIQEFERTLITPNSKFDKYLKGDKNILTAEEINGYELFKEYNCATCHVGENLGGQSYELMGVRADYFGDRGTEITFEDHGRNKETSS